MLPCLLPFLRETLLNFSKVFRYCLLFAIPFLFLVFLYPFLVLVIPLRRSRRVLRRVESLPAQRMRVAGAVVLRPHRLGPSLLLSSLLYCFLDLESLSSTRANFFFLSSCS